MAEKNFLTEIIDADLAEGKVSEIHTRFPPEPNGYLHIGSETMYLAIVKDLYDKEIVGWSLDTHMRTELCTAALEAAVKKRRPQAGLIHHSDRGSQYCSHSYQEYDLYPFCLTQES